MSNIVELGQIPFVKDRIWTVSDFKGVLCLPHSNVQIWATEKIIRVAFTSKSRNTVLYKLRVNELSSDSERYMRAELCFYSYVELVSILYNLLCEGYVLVVWE